MRKLKIAMLSAALCTAAALAQVAPENPGTDADSQAASTSPVAYVYVSSLIGSSSTAEVFGYAATPAGKLTHIPGSPFAADVGYVVSNGKYLFGSTQSGTDIDAYLIESNGALRFSAATRVPTPAADSGCGFASALTLDHTGASLYNFDDDGVICANNAYQNFNVEKATGKLAYLGLAGDSEDIDGPLTFSGNNKFAYTVGCFHFSGGISGFKRNSDGSLTELNISPAFPADCGTGAAADPTDHVAFAVQSYSGFADPSGPFQLATYTVTSTGNLTTTSTRANMPKVLVGEVSDLNMAPSGKLLAVAGSTGLQVFHFNGASPITHFTGLLTKDEVDQIYWDNKNHLYAIGSAANKLWVFTVTPTGYSQTPGSPYTVHSPQSLIVLPLPL